MASVLISDAEVLGKRYPPNIWLDPFVTSLYFCNAHSAVASDQISEQAMLIRKNVSALTFIEGQAKALENEMHGTTGKKKKQKEKCKERHNVFPNFIYLSFIENILDVNNIPDECN